MQFEPTTPVPWKRYIYAVTEASLIFIAASFCLGLYFMHGGIQHTILSIFLVVLYLVVVGFGIKRMVKQFTIVAIMLMIPIAPLIMLIIAVALIHLLQFFR